MSAATACVACAMASSSGVAAGGVRFRLGEAREEDSPTSALQPMSEDDDAAVRQLAVLRGEEMFGTASATIQDLPVRYVAVLCIFCLLVGSCHLEFSGFLLSVFLS